METETLRLSDALIGRIAQSVQEAMLFARDVTDILRNIECKTVNGEVTMTEEYQKRVLVEHAEALERAIVLSANTQDHIIIGED